MKRNIFMNGITGQVGSFLAQKLLANGCNMYALVRGENPQERIAAMSHKIDIYKHPQLHILSGDVCHNLPQKPDVVIDHFIHIAADLSFSPKDSAQVKTTNITGTNNMLKLAETWQCKYFHYFSTAYIAGKHQGEFKEDDIDLGQEFKNAYEQSKAESEKLCRLWSKKNKGKATLKIYRPGIVMGDYYGSTINYTGFYVFLKILAEIVKEKKRLNMETLRIHSGAQILKNLVPVDYVVEVVAAILEEESSQNETIYLIPKNPPSNQQIRDWLATIFDIPILELVEETPQKANVFERLLEKGLKVYRDYMTSEPNFHSRYSKERIANLKIAEPNIDEQYFRRLIDYGHKDLWGRNKIKTHTANKHIYFTKFLPSFLGKQMLPNLEKISSIFIVKLKGKIQENWRLEINKGVLCSASPCEENITADFCYEVPLATFNLIIEKKIDPRAAFFSGKTDIIGNIEIGLKIANILRLFFNKYPYISTSAAKNKISAVS